MNLNSISETLLRRRTTTSTQQQQNNVDTNNNGVGNTFGVNFSTSTLASALLISSMNQPSSPRPKKSTNNNGDHKENVGEDKTSSGRHRQKDDNTSTAKNNTPPPPPPPPPGPPPARRRPRNKKINSSLVDDTTKKPSSSSISSSGNSKSISPTLLQRRQMNPLSPVNNNSPMNRNQRGVDIGRSVLMKEQKSGNASASDCTTYRSNKSPIVAMNISKVERRRPIVSTSTRSPKERTQNNQATEAARGTTTSTDKKLVSPQPKKQEASNHQVAIKSHTSTTTHTTKSLSPAMKKIIAKYGSGRDCSVNHKLLTSPNISDRKHQQHDTIAKQQQASTTSNTLDTNRYLANKALQLKRNRQQSIQTNVINTKRKEANKKADIVKQFRQQKHRGRCNTSRATKNDSTTSTTAAKVTSNDCKVQRQRSLSVPRKTTKSLEDGLEEIDIQMDNLAVTQSCSFTTTRTTDTNVDNDETNKRRLQMRRKRAREVLARRNKKI